MITFLNLPEPTYEFHVAKKIREKYDLDESFFSLSGNVVFANFYQVRLFVDKINSKRSVDQHVSPGEINGAGLLDEIYHIAIRNYIKNIFPNAFPVALKNLSKNLGVNNFDDLLLEFIEVFPPKKVYKNEQTKKEYLLGTTNNVNNREILLEELILLYLSNRNPAFSRIKEFFDESYLGNKQFYNSAISTLKEFFNKDELKVGITNTDIFDFLSRPFTTYSNSIWDQLEYIKNEWGIFIDKELLLKIKSSKDLFIESFKFDPSPGGGGAPTIVPGYKEGTLNAGHLVIGKSKFKYAEDSAKEYDEPEQFTPDVNWMPNLILMAKNIYVWLDQLSKKYQREIKTLDQIPIEELEQLRRWNINGLWLIGVWERSSSSKRIKHLMGNIDAVASAYSLYDYQIANDLGGEYAYKVFNERAKQHGIRLASDMVPNHTGIYSKWTIQHPDYFVQLDFPPFPNYRFTGENLSEHPDYEIRIEDQYYEMKDAAVVFERKDMRNGETKYIYHGNDGTNMPWNDTAQLNLMKAEVREALIQKIFEVARKFSVIRFDAAMTLAKKHYSRLWFPEPGKGGDIPSRSDYALTRREFDDLFPKEFWREVVDRINEEMPDTLLLAEAFWLMEGYFVRTLGMHRVYNSAFMNMMMNEENSKYRKLITNTLEFEPEILKRYVNFMSNPDEETAIDQFGSGDKYFGVLILMNTLPGLPMFAHGQIEGYTEKYGMEYQRAYYDETPEQWLVEKHEREVFPVLRKRYVFSEVKKYWLYDFLSENGNVNEDVYVYSNQFNNEKGLVIFNNKFASASGTFYFSRQKLNGNSSSAASLYNTNIAYELGAKNSDFHFYLLRDATTGLEYLFNGKELHTNGLYSNLFGYEYRVYLHIEEIFDPSGETYKFYKANYGRGNYSVRRELEKIKLADLHITFCELFSEEILSEFNSLIISKKPDAKKLNALSKVMKIKIDSLINEISQQTLIKEDYTDIKEEFVNNFIDEIKCAKLYKNLSVSKKTTIDKEMVNYLSVKDTDKHLINLLKNTVETIRSLLRDEEVELNFIDELMLTLPINSILLKNLENKDRADSSLLLIIVLLSLKDDFDFSKPLPTKFFRLRNPKKILEFILSEKREIIRELLDSELLLKYLDVNEYNNEKYFSKEKWDELLDGLLNSFCCEYYSSNVKIQKTVSKQRVEQLRFLKKIYLINSYLKKKAISAKFVYSQIVEEIAPNN